MAEMKINNAQLYDAAFLRGLSEAQKISYSRHNLHELYDKPHEVIPFTETLKKVGKTDLSTKYFSPQQLYNRDGRYNVATQLDKESTSSYKYLTTYDTFNNSSFTMVEGNYQLGYLARGAIDPGKGSPIRLKAPNGFYGYIRCMTKGNTIGTVELASAPQSISDNVNVETASDNAVGRSQAFTFFSNVGSRQVQFSFDVYADYLPAPFLDVLSYCKALKQMNYPVYTASTVNSPVVRFEYGGVHIIGIPTITFSFSNTIKKGNIDKATVSVSIVETEDVTDGEAIL